uniref:Uncharacterized protein n=1 Tax=Pyxicephalus adspersus TaxID=30357 RepID=A0AAV3A941_PYXAD|nr:TPA: hypothetical protein GDO54_015705 [Pyxicephalus adspersus]
MFQGMSNVNVKVCECAECEQTRQDRGIDAPLEREDPDIDPSWYTGRGIRPVGRFGRRGTAWEDTQKSMYRPLGHTCIPIEDSLELSDDN